MTNRFSTFREYFDHIQTIAFDSQVVENAWTAFRIVPPVSKWGGTIRCQELRFRDGARLSFTEQVLIDRASGVADRTAYRYHYESAAGDFFFRYDRDSQACFDDLGNYRYDHPECHLHVNDKSPRFMTHATSFEEVWFFIVASFYSQQER